MCTARLCLWIVCVYEKYQYVERIFMLDAQWKIENSKKLLSVCSNRSTAYAICRASICGHIFLLYFMSKRILFWTCVVVLLILLAHQLFLARTHRANTLFYINIWSVCVERVKCLLLVYTVVSVEPCQIGIKRSSTRNNTKHIYAYTTRRRVCARVCTLHILIYRECEHANAISSATQRRRNKYEHSHKMKFPLKHHYSMCDLIIN